MKRQIKRRLKRKMNQLIILVMVVSLGIFKFDTVGELFAAITGAEENSTVTRECRVTSVHDGDSMRVRCPGFKKTLPIRLNYIDAPETDQAYGIWARDQLRQLCKKGSAVTVLDEGKDVYNRHLGQVHCDGIHANAAMVEQGAAWVYEYYAPEDSDLYELQAQAQANKRGLWKATNPTPPWDFRYRQRNKR